MKNSNLRGALRHMVQSYIPAATRGFRLPALRRFVEDRGGVAAIEFAFMAPILICFYLGSMELGQAIEGNKKVGRIASMVGDLVAQQQSVSAESLKGIMDIGAATLKPYTRSAPTIEVTAIEISNQDTPRAVEIWWRRLLPSGATDGGISTTRPADPAVPDDLNERGAFLIRVEASMDYKLVLTYTENGASRFGLGRFFNGIAMSETYYLKPRRSNTITCSDCNRAG